ncbi:MAG: hypothetical protein AAF602_32555, partial [Myxococcota bacterium]
NMTYAIADVVVSNNGLNGGQVRGTAFMATASGSLDRTDFLSNWGHAVSYSAGGTLMLGGDATIRNSIIAFNDISADPGLYTLSAGIEAWGGAHVEVDHTTIAFNTNGGSGARVASMYGSPIDFRNSILFDNQPGSGSCFSSNIGFSIDYTLVTDCGASTPSQATSGTGNVIGVDPQFANGPSGDFTLDVTSPAIDVGDPGVTDASDGTRSDLGAYAGPGR